MKPDLSSSSHPTQTHTFVVTTATATSVTTAVHVTQPQRGDDTHTTSPDTLPYVPGQAHAVPLHRRHHPLPHDDAVIAAQRLIAMAPSQVVLASLVLADVDRLSSAVVTDAAGERLLSAVDALVHSDARRVRRAMLTIPTAERLLSAVDALVLRDVRRHSSAILAIATAERLLAAVDALMASDVRRLSSSILAIPTAERLFGAVDTLVRSDGRRVSSSILTIPTAERLLARVTALVLGDDRWVVSAILAIPTAQPLHTRTVITSASHRVVATICATRRTQTQSSQPPRNQKYTIRKHAGKHTTATTALHATRHLPSSSASPHTWS
jgi:hypothetical protein